MRDALRKHEIPTRILSSPNKEGRFPPFHDFNSISDEGGDALIVDLGWQQMLPEPDDNKPEVLISRRSKLPQTLTSLGVPQDKHHYWLDAA